MGVSLPLTKLLHQLIVPLSYVSTLLDMKMGTVKNLLMASMEMLPILPYSELIILRFFMIVSKSGLQFSTEHESISMPSDSEGK
jgi:hypothetical protein